MEGTYSIDIQAPRQDVFEFLDDEDNLKKIVPNLIEAGVIQETPEKVGSTFWHVYEENGRKMKMTGEVTEHQAPERLASSSGAPSSASRSSARAQHASFSSPELASDTSSRSWVYCLERRWKPRARRH